MQATSTVTHGGEGPSSGAPGPSGAGGHHSSRNPFARLDAAMDRFFGTDLKLLYGMLGPILVVCGVIFVLAFDPNAAWVALAVVLEVIGLGLIVVKLMAMLSDEDDA